MPYVVTLLEPIFAEETLLDVGAEINLKEATDPILNLLKDRIKSDIKSMFITGKAMEYLFTPKQVKNCPCEKFL